MSLQVHLLEYTTLPALINGECNLSKKKLIKLLFSRYQVINDGILINLSFVSACILLPKITLRYLQNVKYSNSKVKDLLHMLPQHAPKRIYFLNH